MKLSPRNRARSVRAAVYMSQRLFVQRPIERAAMALLGMMCLSSFACDDSGHACSGVPFVSQVRLRFSAAPGAALEGATVHVCSFSARYPDGVCASGVARLGPTTALASLALDPPLDQKKELVWVHADVLASDAGGASTLELLWSWGNERGLRDGDVYSTEIVSADGSVLFQGDRRAAYDKVFPDGRYCRAIVQAEIELSP